MTTERGDGSKVSLDTRAAAGIRAGNDEDATLFSDREPQDY
jgi:hypothetical protein